MAVAATEHRVSADRRLEPLSPPVLSPVPSQRKGSSNRHRAPQPIAASRGRSGMDAFVSCRQVHCATSILEEQAGSASLVQQIPCHYDPLLRMIPPLGPTWAEPDMFSAPVSAQPERRKSLRRTGRRNSNWKTKGGIFWVDSAGKVRLSDL